MESFKNQLKMLLMSKNMTMTQLVELLNERYGRTDSLQNLANKIRKETIRYSEVMEIAEVLNIQIQWTEIKPHIDKPDPNPSEMSEMLKAIQMISEKLENHQYILDSITNKTPVQIKKIDKFKNQFEDIDLD